MKITKADILTLKATEKPGSQDMLSEVKRQSENQQIRSAIHDFGVKSRFPLYDTPDRYAAAQLP